MDSLLHSLNIGTLATWLSVAGFGAVGMLVPPRPAAVDSHPAVPETQCPPQDFTLGGGGASDPMDPMDPMDTPEAPVPVPLAMPELTELAPLPALPEASPVLRPSAPAPRSAMPAGESSLRRSVGHPATASGVTGATGGGSAMSAAARLAAGRMPPPDYPAAARRLGQTGSLLVEFTVDSSGRVLAAYAITPSPWPLLPAQAVNAVRHWTFPPGPVMKLQRPIVFQLH